MAKKYPIHKRASAEPRNSQKVCDKCGRITTFRCMGWNRPDGSIRHVMVCTRCYSTISMLTA